MAALVVINGGLDERSRGAACEGARDADSRGASAPAVPEDGHLRLTRRGRAVVVALALLLGVFLGFMGGRADASSAPVAPTAIVVVEPGDSLWAIARDVASPGEDLRDVVAEIQRLNDLPTAAIPVGAVLRVPVR